MLNTHKLLYVLPDLAYLAELLPAKKEYTFSIQSFRQINGEFLNDTELLPTSIEKLFSKIDSEEYHLILPDFLFTNTIVSVDGTTESAVLDHVQKKLLPELKLSKDTHEIETTVLTSFKGASKVQISAIEKDVLAPIRVAAEKAKITISAISPLTWVVKSIISLEPSISVLQVGSHLYAAQHYIGVDQASSFPLDEYDAIVETIKTLKGAEPSIQSVYLVSSNLVEEDIKSKLSDTLPIQQLASFKEDDAKMPSYVKFIIESSMRTISIPDFPVPQFKLGKASEADYETLKNASPALENSTKEKELPEPTKKEKGEVKTSEKEEKKVTDTNKTEPADSELPAPTAVPATIGAVKDAESISMTDKKEETKNEPVETIEALKEEKKEEPQTEKKSEKSEEELPNIPEIGTKLESSKPEENDKIAEEKTPENKEESKTEKSEIDSSEDNEKPDTDKDEVDLKQFAGADDSDTNGLAVDDNDDSQKSDIKNEVSKKAELKTTKKVIKNSSGVNNMLKMVFITIAVFFITIAIGVGVGLGLLKMSEDKVADTTPAVVTETPTPEATPEPTPEPVEIDKEAISILVVNATTKAGYAGKVKALLVDAEISNVDAANAKGDYDEGSDYLLMLEENATLQTLLEESTDLTFTYSEDAETEDPDGDYDAIIVLAD